MPQDEKFPSFDELLAKFGTSFFEDEQKQILRAELVDEVARGLGFYFSQKGSGNNSVNRAQMRRFYNDAKSLETKIESIKAEDFSRFRAAVVLIKAKAAYAAGRKEVKIPETFKRFLDTGINLALQGDVRDFKAFMLVFQSVVGYYYGFGGGKGE